MSSRPSPRPMPLKPQAYRSRALKSSTGVTAWTVFIDGLEVVASIGIHPHEREARQRILIDVELDMTGSPTPKEDRLAETADYEAIARDIATMAREGHVQLVETLAERIAKRLLSDQRAVKAKVRVSKPEALSNARGVGAEVVVSRG